MPLHLIQCGGVCPDGSDIFCDANGNMKLGPPKVKERASLHLCFHLFSEKLLCQSAYFRRTISQIKSRYFACLSNDYCTGPKLCVKGLILMEV